MTRQHTPSKIHMLSDSDLGNVSHTIPAMRRRVLMYEDFLDIHPVPKYEHVVKHVKKFG